MRVCVQMQGCVSMLSSRPCHCNFSYICVAACTCLHCLFQRVTRLLTAKLASNAVSTATCHGKSPFGKSTLTLTKYKDACLQQRSAMKACTARYMPVKSALHTHKRSYAELSLRLRRMDRLTLSTLAAEPKDVGGPHAAFAMQHCCSATLGMNTSFHTSE